MVIFHSYVSHYQRVRICSQTATLSTKMSPTVPIRRTLRQPAPGERLRDPRWPIFHPFFLEGGRWGLRFQLQVDLCKFCACECLMTLKLKAAHKWSRMMSEVVANMDSNLKGIFCWGGFSTGTAERETTNDCRDHSKQGPEKRYRINFQLIKIKQLYQVLGLFLAFPSCLEFTGLIPA